MAEDGQDSGEKEFEASEQRLKQAREDGNIVQSKEVGALATIIGVLISALLFQTYTGTAIFELLSGSLYHAELMSNDVFASGGIRTLGWLRSVLLTLFPLLAILLIIVVLSLIVTRSVAFSAKKIKPDIKKLSPVDNIKKKYGLSGLLDFARDMAKMIFAGVIATVFLLNFAQDYYASSAVQLGQFTSFTFNQCVRLILYFGAFQLCLAIIDYPAQKRLHANRLKMTREEMKKEAKQSEGDPQLKQSRRAKAAQITSSKMLQNIEGASIVIVNPEHYAVVLKWDPDAASAPICVAKGLDHVAAKIREIAGVHGVPIYRDPPVARSMHKLVEIDEEIRPEHFAAVAAAMQFVQSVSDKA